MTPVMVSAARIDESTDLIEHLDFEVPCGHAQHETQHADEAAAYYAMDWCHECRVEGRFFLCHSGWVLICKSEEGECGNCGHRDPPLECCKILEVLR